MGAKASSPKVERMTRIDLNGRVAIVTGAGGGLGRAHALQLARAGARVVVNDLGGTIDGSGGSPNAAEAVAAEIRAAGGDAFANGASVTDFAQVEAMVADALARWGRVDILVNNAGILRDRTFAKMDLEDFRAVLDVHLWGAVHCTKAVWETMRAQQHGRILLTTSSSGLYGNFGQSAYGAAKMALVGLMNTLHLEGERYGIRVNCLAPSAATRMTQAVFSPEQLSMLVPESVSPAVVALCADDAPSRRIVCAGGGAFAAANITLTRGRYMGAGPGAAERLANALDAIGDRAGEIVPASALEQSQQEQQLWTKAVASA